MITYSILKGHSHCLVENSFGEGSIKVWGNSLEASAVIQVCNGKALCCSGWGSGDGYLRGAVYRMPDWLDGELDGRVERKDCSVPVPSCREKGGAIWAARKCGGIVVWGSVCRALSFLFGDILPLHIVWLAPDLPQASAQISPY